MDNDKENVKSACMLNEQNNSSTVEKLDSCDIKAKKRSIYINLFVLCLVWFFIFSPYMALEVLQSSLNPAAGLGVTAISVLYTTKIVSSFFGPIIIHKLTAKWTLVMGFVCHTLFVVANYYPRWITLLTAGALVGMTVGPLWICNGVYVTTLASEMAELTGQPKGAVLSKFYGIFGLIPPLTGIIGNFVSSVILKSIKTDNSANEIDLNSTSHVITSSINSNISISYQCGASYCPYKHDEYIKQDTSAVHELPDITAVYILLTIYLSMSVLGTLLTIIFLRNIKEKKSNDSFVQSVMKNIQSLFADYRLNLLIPVFFFMFMRRATVYASFTKAFITCSLGVDMVGFVMAARGVASITASYISGQVGQKIHRNYQFLLAVIFWVGVTLTWLFWDPQPHQIYMFFLIAIVSGMVNSVDIVQIQAFIGKTFSDKKAEAYACQNFWSGIAMAGVFAYSSHLCFDIQTYILSGVGLLSITGYIILVTDLRKKRIEKERGVENEDKKASEEKV